MSDLKTRVITAIVLILVFLSAILIGGYALRAFVCFIAIITSYEYYSFSLKTRKEPKKISTILFSLYSLFSFFGYAICGYQGLFIGLLIGFILAVITICYII